MKTLIRPALTLLLFFTLLTGLAYPLLVTCAGRVLFPRQADGSLAYRNGKPVGSFLIGQNFSEPGYFWGRLSATASFPYNAMASGGSNYGPLNPALARASADRVAALRAADSAAGKTVPADLATASGSGLDPEITAAAALYQAPRIAGARHMPLPRVLDLIRSETRGPFMGFSGAPRVNVLRLNLALDAETGS